MTKPSFDPNAFIDDEEAALAAALANPNFRPESVMTAELRAEFEARRLAAGETGAEEISLKVPHTDLSRLRDRAHQQGVAYKSLINSLIHKYVSE